MQDLKILIYIIVTFFMQPGCLLYITFFPIKHASLNLDDYTQGKSHLKTGGKTFFLSCGCAMGAGRGEADDKEVLGEVFWGLVCALCAACAASWSSRVGACRLMASAER